MQPRRLLTSSSPGQNLCRITAAYPANDLLRPLPPQSRGLFFSNYRDTNGAVNVYGLCGFSTHWPGGHCQGTPSLTLTVEALQVPPAPQGAPALLEVWVPLLRAALVQVLVQVVAQVLVQVLVQVVAQVLVQVLVQVVAQVLVQAVAQVQVLAQAQVLE